MVEQIILYRVGDGPVQAVLDDAGEICIFPDMDAVVSFCDCSALFQSGQADYQIVELSDL